MRAILTSGHWTAPAVLGSVVKEGYRTRRWFVHRLRKATLTQEGKQDINRVNLGGLEAETSVDWKLQISYLPVKKKKSNFELPLQKHLLLSVGKLWPRKAALTWVRNIHLEKVHDAFAVGWKMVGGRENERLAVIHTGGCSDLDNHVQLELG